MMMGSVKTVGLIGAVLLCLHQSPKQISNPVVYKLLRVEVDGTLVPATDDEVMEVEEFFKYENSGMRVVADTGQSLECISIERSSSGKLRLDAQKALQRQIWGN